MLVLKKNVSFFLKYILQILFRDNFLFRINTKKKCVALTFDDGPHETNTKAILNVLDERNIKATFFVLGSQLESNWDLVKKLLNNGHNLGNHTYDHIDLKKSTLNDLHESLLKTKLLLKELNPECNNKFFRSPYGRLDFRLIHYIIKHNLLFVSWNIDSLDSFIHDAKELAQYVSGLHINNGDILLFHEDYKQTVSALPDILDNLIARGFKFVTISEIINNDLQ